MWDAVVTKSRLQTVLTMGWWPSIPSWHGCNSEPNKRNAGVLCQTDGGKKDKYLLHYNRTNINNSKAIILIVDLFIR